MSVAESVVLIDCEFSGRPKASAVTLYQPACGEVSAVHWRSPTVQPSGKCTGKHSETFPIIRQSIEHHSYLEVHLQFIYSAFSL